VERFDWAVNLIKANAAAGVLRARGFLLGGTPLTRSHRFTGASGKSDVEFPLGVTVLDYMAALQEQGKLHPKISESYALEYVAHV